MSQLEPRARADDCAARIKLRRFPAKSGELRHAGGCVARVIEYTVANRGDLIAADHDRIWIPLRNCPGFGKRQAKCALERILPGDVSLIDLRSRHFERQPEPCQEGLSIG